MAEGSSTPFSPTNFDAYNIHLQTSALTTTRKAAGLPTDLAFHRSMDQELAESLDIFSGRVLSVTNRLLSLVTAVDRTKVRGTRKAKLESEEDVVDSFHSLVVDAMDQLLERTVRFSSIFTHRCTDLDSQDISLDDGLGKNKPPAIEINPAASNDKVQSFPFSSSIMSKHITHQKFARKPGSSKARAEPIIQHASYLAKPQLLFKRKFDNTDAPWYPTLSHKYNAKVPLGHIYYDEGESNAVV